MIRDTRLKSADAIRRNDKCFSGIKLFAEGTVPAGYNGDYDLCEYGLKGNRIVSVHSFGYYDMGLPDVIDTDEALWILNHHPSARHVKVSQ